MKTSQCCERREKSWSCVSHSCFNKRHTLPQESYSTVNFCAPFKTSVNDMKYRERGNGLDRAGSAALSTWLHIDSAELESVIYRPLLPLYCIVLYGDIVHSVTYRQHINHCIVPSVFSVWIIFPRSDRARGWKKHYHRSNECIVVMMEVYTFCTQVEKPM